MEPRPKAFARILPVYNRLFPEDVLQDLWRQAQPHNYRYKIRPTAVPLALLHAFISRAPNTPTIPSNFARTLGTTSRSTFSDLLASPVFAKFASLMLVHFEDKTRPLCPALERLCPVDSMAVALPSTIATNAPKINSTTRGVGLTWMLDLEPQSGSSPLRVLSLHSGARNDAAFFLTHPGRLMPDDQATGVHDRGFSSHRGIRERLERGEHFLVRLRKSEVKHWRCLRRLSRRKRFGSLKIEHDMIARIGKSTPVTVRLVRAERPGGELLIVATDRMEWSLGQILEGYRQRWPIEPMHKVLKETIGLGHLYSFQEAGLKALTCLAGLIWVGMEEQEKKWRADGKVDVVASIREGVKTLRRKVNNAGTYRRNMVSKRWKKKKKRSRAAATNRPPPRGRNTSAPG